jgi:WD40 repeat protein
MLSRSEDFIGRKSFLKKLHSYISGAVTHPLIIYGSSGDGKSALLAKVAGELLKTNSRVIYRFIGASPESSDGRSLLLGLCQQLSEVVGLPKPPDEDNVFQISQNFRTLLSNVQEPITIIIDAIDQLTGEDESKYLTWIPNRIPKTVKLLIATTDGEMLSLLRQKGIPTRLFLRVPPLSLKDARSIVKSLCNKRQTSLTVSGRKMIEGGFLECRSPLFLYIAFQRASQWASYDQPQHPGSSPQEAIKVLLEELSSGEKHGKVLLRKCLQWITLSRFGLSHNELCELFSSDGEVMKEAVTRHPESPDPGSTFPPILWFRLYYDLLPYLKAQTAGGVEVFSFFHNVWSDVIGASLGPSKEKAVHTQLALFFSSRKDETALTERLASSVNHRFLSEGPYHQRKAGLVSDIKKTLLNENFLEGKITHFGVLSLISDYANALTGFPKFRKGDSPIQELHDFLNRNANILVQNPDELAAQLLSNRASFESQSSRKISEALLKRRKGVWLRPEPQSNAARAIIRVFDYERGITSSFFIEQGDRSSPRSWGMDSFSDGNRIVVAHHDGVIRISDLATGKTEGVIVGHTSEVNAVTLSADQKAILSVSSDGALMVSSAVSYERLMEFHTKEGLHSVASHPTLQIAATGGHNGMTRIWDLETGKQIKAMKVHKETVWYMRFDRSGEFLYSVSQDGRLIERSVASGKIVKSFGPLKGAYGFTILLRALDVSKDNKYLVVGDGDGYIMVFDRERFERVREWRAHDTVIRGLAVSPDSKKIISVSQDGFVKVWNLKRGKQARSFNEHGAEVNSVRINDNGKHFYSGDAKGRILVWNLPAVRSKQIAHRVHNGSIVALIPEQDGDRFISVSDDGTIAQWRSRSREVVFSTKVEVDTYQHRDRLSGCLLHPSGRYLVALSQKMLFCLDIETKEITQASTNNQEVFASFLAFESGHLVVNITDNSKLSWWTLPDLNLVRTRNLGYLPVSSFDMTQDRSKILAHIWDRNTFCLIRLDGKRRKRVKLPKRLATSRSIFFLNNRTAVSHLKNGTLCTWDIESSQIIRKFSQDVVDFTISRNKRRIIAASQDGVLHTWDYNSGKYHQLGEVNGNDIHNIQMIPGGSLLLFVTSDSILNLFDWRHNTKLSTFSVHSEISIYRLLTGQNQLVLGETSGRLHLLNIVK